jgi:hypothetical protein
MVVVSIVFFIQLMFFDLSVQLQWVAKENTGGIRRTADKLNTGQKQAGNIKDKNKEGKDIKYDFIKNFVQLSACTTKIIRDTLCYKKNRFPPNKMPFNKLQF